MRETPLIKSDVLIIGTGVAGLALSLYLDEKLSVNIVTKSRAEHSSSYQAQGGIACVTAAGDSFEEHIRDTLEAGDGLCDLKVVETVVKAAPQAIKDIEKWGVEFSGGNQTPELGREGGHSRRRILHREDSTGAELESKLLNRVRDKRTLFEEHTAVNLIMNAGRCAGAYVLDNATLEIKSFYARAVVLATGGCGKAYLYTTNPAVATGDGVAMAYRAGAKIANMEFIQFHPTSLYSPLEESFLITEAMRGEGAVLKNSSGESFMEKYDTRGNLAPRDIVARAIDSEMKREGVKHLYLDIHSFREAAFIKSRFPAIYKKLKKIGIDITRDDIPVVPSAHYCCGGVNTDLDGFTGVEGLYAVGETAHTGLHGANRLASNSLLEALVYARRAAESIPGYLEGRRQETPAPWSYTGDRLPEEKVFIEHNWESIRRIMWNYVGVLRSDYRLSQAEERLKLIENDVNYHYWNYLLTPALVELRNLLDTARIIVKSASIRKESRGLNYNVDHPNKLSEAGENTYVIKK